MKSRKIYHQEYYKKNKEKILLQTKKFRETHKEMRAESSSRYKKLHKEKIKEYLQRQNTKELAKKYAHKRRAKAKGLKATLTPEQWEQTKLLFDNKCAYCGKEKKLEQDHFISLYYGGEYTHNNIIPSCESCNKSKQEKYFFKWYPTYKYYSKAREKKILKILNYVDGVQQLALF